MEGVPGTFCLRLHAAYQCRHSGVCCSTDWMISAEPHVLQVVRSHGVTAIDGSGRLFVPDPNGPDPLVARRPDGTCIFFNRDGRRLCLIHGVAGRDALPSACRHFPREILQDPRGTFISLSHFCPTAAALLLDAEAGALSVTEAAPPLRLDGPIDGMDALEALPPLLRPGVLADYEGYGAWERACLETLARPELTYRQGIGIIAAATDRIRQWEPGEESLAECVRRIFRLKAEATDPIEAKGVHAASRISRLKAEEAPLTASAPWFHVVAARHFPVTAAPVAEFEAVWLRVVEPSLRPFDLAIRRYLGARFFANWVCYQGRGWRTIVAWVCTALGVLENELARRCAASGRALTREDFIAAVGATDLLLLHTVDSENLARHFAPAEGPEPT